MALLDFILTAMRLESADTPAAPSPKMLKAIADLVNAIGGHQPAASWISPEGVKAAADLIVAVAWPVAVVVVIFNFRAELSGLLNRINKFSAFGVTAAAEIQTELNKSAKQAASKFTDTPSTDELSRADTVEKLAKQDVALIRQQVDALALEYDDVRGSMPSGDKRTSEMEKIVSKMRTIGKAAYAIRWELTASPSPGHHLQAVACLQVRPDYEMLGWLAQCFQNEKPFVSYHAIVAMVVATEAVLRSQEARQYAKDFKMPYQKVKESSRVLTAGSETKSKLDELERQMKLLLPVMHEAAE